MERSVTNHQNVCSIDIEPNGIECSTSSFLSQNSYYYKCSLFSFRLCLERGRQLSSGTITEIVWRTEYSRDSNTKIIRRNILFLKFTVIVIWSFAFFYKITFASLSIFRLCTNLNYNFFDCKTFQRSNTGPKNVFERPNFIEINFL
jgi:hypothetical protein